MKPEEALDQIAYMRQLVTESRVRVADSWPYFLLWGVLWVIGYLGTLWMPAPAGDWVWPVIYVVGGLLSWLVGSRSGSSGPVPSLLKKLGRMSLVFFLGGVAILFLFGTPDQLHAVNAFYPFLIGLVYMANGLFIGRELVYIGTWLIVAGAAGVWLPSPLQDLFLAGAGGGGLVLTGLLLRRQVGRA